METPGVEDVTESSFHTPEITQSTQSVGPPKIGGREWERRGIDDRGANVRGRIREDESGGVVIPGVGEDEIVPMGKLREMAGGLSPESLGNAISLLGSALEKRKSVEKQHEKLLAYFFERGVKEKRKVVERAMEELNVLSEDAERIQAVRRDEEGGNGRRRQYGLENGSLSTPKRGRTRLCDENEVDSMFSQITAHSGAREGFGASKVATKLPPQSKRPELLMAEPLYSQTMFEDFQKNYFENVGCRRDAERTAALREFAEDMRKATRYNKFERRSTMRLGYRASDILYEDSLSSQPVSSLDFNCNSTLFAAASLKTKRIKVYQFTDGRDENPCPVQVVESAGNVSYITWSPAFRQLLLSAEQDGSIVLWDAHHNKVVKDYDEHDSCVWSVDFNQMNPKTFVSGSNDGRLKLWSTLMGSSVMTITHDHSICSVAFNPRDPYSIAFGSVDNYAYIYDVRHARKPLHSLDCESRVSHVEFMDPKNLVTTSLDSSLKLWDLDTLELRRRFTGHSNQVRFVGCSVNSDYMLCGSENNALFAYYKNVSSPIAQYNEFRTIDVLTGDEVLSEDNTSCVSAVRWCPKFEDMCIVGNSEGIMKVLELAKV